MYKPWLLIHYKSNLNQKSMAFLGKFPRVFRQLLRTGCAWNVLDIILVLAQVTEEVLLAVADSDGQDNADVPRWKAKNMVITIVGNITMDGNIYI